MLGIDEIMSYLPHRYPFLLIDRILEFEENKRVVGIKNVTINEPFFQGHFPGHPIMPGVLLVEAMAQAGGGIRQQRHKPAVVEVCMGEKDVLDRKSTRLNSSHQKSSYAVFC